MTNHLPLPRFVSLALLAWPLLFCKSINGKRFVHDVRAIPYATLSIKLISRVVVVESAQRDDRVYPIFGARSFNINNNHNESIAVKQTLDFSI
jgi:hypothetical protein